MSWFNDRRLAVTGLLVVTAGLSGCSDIYYDRRETIAFGGNDAVAANQAVQTIDPWPAASANRRMSSNGEVVAAGIERYRTGRVTPPKGTGTSATYQQQQSQQGPGGATAAAVATSKP